MRDAARWASCWEDGSITLYLCGYTELSCAASHDPEHRSCAQQLISISALPFSVSSDLGWGRCADRTPGEAGKRKDFFLPTRVFKRVGSRAPAHDILSMLPSLEAHSVH